MNNELQGLRIVLADDHAMVRLGFRLLLEGAGAAVVAEARGEGAIRLYAEHSPDVLVMDVSMPGIGGLAALERLLGVAPKARVLMLSAHEDAIVPVRAMRSAPGGYLCKRAEPTNSCAAVGEVARDRRYLDPALAQVVALAQLSGTASPVER
jgi:two-component system invasion response regulator UvrY